MLGADRFSIDFGSIAVSSSSPASVVKISNGGRLESGSISAIVTGSSPTQLKVQNACTTISGGFESSTIAPMVTGAAEFTVQNGCTTLIGGGTCVISVVFSPTTAGTRTATLIVTSAPGGTLQISLTGVATN